MEEQLEQCREESLYLCDRLITEFNQNQEEAASFLSGDIYNAYLKATEAAINKVKRTRNKIRNL